MPQKQSLLWQKNAQANGDDWTTRFTVGDDYRWDTLLLPYDIRSTRAHAGALTETGVLTAEERTRIEGALDELEGDVEDGTVTVTPADEDCHTVIEQFLTERLGETGEKIHAGRSRNDQVLVAVRMFLRDKLRALGRQTVAIAEALCALGERYDDAPMPGYTHLQRAMPTTAGLWALGYAEVLAADLGALRDACRRVNVSPYGSAAGYGVPHLDLPRRAVAERLGFRAVQTHAPAVQLTRGKLELGVVHALVQVAGPVNRLAADLSLFTTSEFAFADLPDALTTGSSIMPQKRNPDVAEIARATYHRLTAQMQLLQSLPANLPSGYHRDLQFTKAAVMKSALMTEDLLEAARRLAEGVTFDREAMRAACTPELFATAEAMERVAEGVPFRTAYRGVGSALDALSGAPDAETALAAYHTDGTPGQGRPDLVRQRLAEYEEWGMRDS
ncbi:MAG: argininosuccinate lyase [Bacteroidetes bacterium QH_8_67_23]|nr:MAG: argininosuccinate lyase [Bacteroidetes bacterium QH_8_67_23]